MTASAEIIRSEASDGDPTPPHYVPSAPAPFAVILPPSLHVACVYVYVRMWKMQAEEEAPLLLSPIHLLGQDAFCLPRPPSLPAAAFNATFATFSSYVAVAVAFEVFFERTRLLIVVFVLGRGLPPIDCLLRQPVGLRVTFILKSRGTGPLGGPKGEGRKGEAKGRGTNERTPFLSFNFGKNLRKCRNIIEPKHLLTVPKQNTRSCQSVIPVVIGVIATIAVILLFPPGTSKKHPSR